METGLEGKRVLVTGGTRGIGRATALAFSRAGARVVACHRGAHEPDEELLQALGALHRADVTRQPEVAALAEAVRDGLGGLDVLVNNAGADGSAPLARLDEEEWARVMDRNATASYRVTRAVLPLLAPGASVVNIGSAAALRGRPAAAHYSAAKAALLGFTRALCKELGPQGIRVNTIAPGMVADEVEARGPVAEKITAMTPLGRLCRPEDVASAALFLGSDSAAFVSGITLDVDGGI
ncbi:SDR family oxidoreductase [Streptomyces albus subsp. chlorinus]|uniref:SDR family NAD(P)-dependent oxidoreductase n=1 Tax=Streptomyces albus TaxID=1888 RepID=UPI00156D5E93|nr:SDR family oxidoreductase [Streptomyces albus]NSC21551.1 SDR family oxidoreductase [Streptomyces albus subsp. chlorinus]